WQILGGGFGLLLAELSNGLFGWGTILLLILSLFIFIIFYFNVTSIPAFQPVNPKPVGVDAIPPKDEMTEGPMFTGYADEEDQWVEVTEKETEVPQVNKEDTVPAAEEKEEPATGTLDLDVGQVMPPPKKDPLKSEPEFTIEERRETDA